jgi:hypothetical protein
MSLIHYLKGSKVFIEKPYRAIHLTRKHFAFAKNNKMFIPNTPVFVDPLLLASSR